MPSLFGLWIFRPSSVYALYLPRSAGRKVRGISGEPAEEVETKYRGGKGLVCFLLFSVFETKSEKI